MSVAHTNLTRIDFGAPVGRRVRVMGALAVAAIGFFVILNLSVAFYRHAPARVVWITGLAPLIGFAIMVPLYLQQQIRGYRLRDGNLHVLRRGRENVFSLTGLRSVEAAPGATRGSRKIFGNDGLGAIVGEFTNERLGDYEALLTDLERAVVLRLSDRCLVVSPDRPADFVEAVLAQAGLRR